MNIPKLDLKKLTEQSPLQLLNNMILRKDILLFSEIGRKINKLSIDLNEEAKDVLSVNLNYYIFLK